MMFGSNACVEIIHFITETMCLTTVILFSLCPFFYCRLHFFWPSYIDASVDYGNITIHEGILPVERSSDSAAHANMSVGGHVFYDYYDGTGVYTDFYVNSTEEITVSSYLINIHSILVVKSLCRFL